MDPNLFLAALGLPEGATSDQVVAFATAAKASSEAQAKLLATVEAVSIDEAVGKIAALKGANERAQAAETQLSEMRAEAEKVERAGIVEKLRADGKVTPAQEQSLLPALSLESLKAFAATAPAILKGDGHREPNAGKSYAGKAYAEMTNLERAELHADDPDLFTQLRNQAGTAASRSL
jgi:hypothetical protein